MENENLLIFHLSGKIYALQKLVGIDPKLLYSFSIFLECVVFIFHILPNTFIFSGSISLTKII